MKVKYFPDTDTAHVEFTDPTFDCFDPHAVQKQRPPDFK